MLKKIRKWDFSHPFLFWGGLYMACFIGSIILASVIITFEPDLVIKPENSKNAIGTLVQIQATIIAIVISLTILAVQITASKYSSRVIEVFKKHPNMWFFLISYLISIFVGLFFVALLDNQLPFAITNGTIILLFLGFFLFMMLVPYILNSFEFLNAKNTLKRLSRNIDIKTINSQIDPFQSVFDVIYGAIKNYDFTTMSEGLVIIESRFKEISMQDISFFERDYISFRFFDDIKRCGFLLIERKEEKYVFEIITRLLTLSEWALEKEDNIILNQAIKAIQDVGVISGHEFTTSPTHHAIRTLKSIGILIHDIVDIDKKNGLIQNLIHIVNSLETIGENSIYDRQYETTILSIESILKIGHKSTTSNIPLTEEPYTKNLMKIASICIEQQNTYILIKTLSTLKEHCSLFLLKGRTQNVIEIIEKFKQIGKDFGKKWHYNEIELNKSLQYIEYFYEQIAILAHQRKYEDITELAIQNITELHLRFPSGFEIFSYNLGEHFPVRVVDYKGEYQKISMKIIPEGNLSGKKPFENKDDDEIIVIS